MDKSKQEALETKITLNEGYQRVVSISLFTLSIIAITWGLAQMKSVLIPFVFSLFLYLVTSPLMNWTRKKLSVPKWLTILMTFVVIFSIFSLLIVIIASSVKSIISSSDRYVQECILLLNQYSGFLANFGIRVDVAMVQKTILNLPIFDWIKEISSSLVTIVSNIVLILIFFLFLVLGEDSESGKKKMLDLELRSKITRYLATKFFMSTATGVITGIILMAFGVPMTLLFALLTFFMNFIPNIGSIIAVAIPLPVVFLEYGIGVQLFTILLLTGATQFLIGNILDPKIMGESLGINPVAVLLALLFWGFIWGVPGMFLAVPLTAIIKLLVTRSKIPQYFKTLLRFS